MAGSKSDKIHSDLGGFRGSLRGTKGNVPAGNGSFESRGSTKGKCPCRGLFKAGTLQPPSQQNPQRWHGWHILGGLSPSLVAPKAMSLPRGFSRLPTSSFETQRNPQRWRGWGSLGQFPGSGVAPKAISSPGTFDVCLSLSFQAGWVGPR